MQAATTSAWSLLGLALSISLDELAVGFSVGLLGLPLLPLLLLIALQAVLAGLAEQWIGQRLGAQVGSAVEHVVGPVLCLVEAWIIVAELLGVPF
jgi:manganese efflux pump family protein